MQTINCARALWNDEEYREKNRSIKSFRIVIWISKFGSFLKRIQWLGTYIIQPLEKYWIFIRTKGTICGQGWNVRYIIRAKNLFIFDTHGKDLFELWSRYPYGHGPGAVRAPHGRPASVRVIAGAGQRPQQFIALSSLVLIFVQRNLSSTSGQWTTISSSIRVCANCSVEWIRGGYGVRQ